MILLYTTFPDRETAQDVVSTLIEERLIACANMVETDSIYRWEDEIVDESEYLALCKTDETKKESVRDRLTNLHPYEIPCIVFYRADDAAAPYAGWVEKML